MKSSSLDEFGSPFSSLNNSFYSQLQFPMIEKGKKYDSYEDYEEWSQKKLNDRIMALYDQIEKVTIENLSIAQKNSELEIQIQTIDEVIQNKPKALSPCFYEESERVDLREQYGQLLNDHLVLAERVAKIEELLSPRNEKKSYLAKDNQSTLQRVTSIQDLMKNSRKRTVQKAKYEGRFYGGESTRRDETARKGRYL